MGRHRHERHDMSITSNVVSLEARREVWQQVYTNERGFIVESSNHGRIRFKTADATTILDFMESVIFAQNLERKTEFF